MQLARHLPEVNQAVVRVAQWPSRTQARALAHPVVPALDLTKPRLNVCLCHVQLENTRILVHVRHVKLARSLNLVRPLARPVQLGNTQRVVQHVRHVNRARSLNLARPRARPVQLGNTQRVVQHVRHVNPARSLNLARLRAPPVELERTQMAVRHVLHVKRVHSLDLVHSRARPVTQDLA